jgi:hypothetical protein
MAAKIEKLVITPFMTLVSNAVGADAAWRAEYIVRLKAAGDNKAAKALIRNEAWVSIMARKIAQAKAGASLTGRVTREDFEEALRILSKNDISAKVNARDARENALYALARKNWSLMLAKAGVDAVQKRAPSVTGSGKGKKGKAAPSANQSRGVPTENDATVNSGKPAPVPSSTVTSDEPAPATAPLVLPAFRDANELVMFMLSEATKLRQLFAKNADCGKGDKRAEHVRKATELYLSALAKVPAKG